jgi:hypothetical protein
MSWVFGAGKGSTALTLLYLKLSASEARGNAYMITMILNATIIDPVGT